MLFYSPPERIGVINELSEATLDTWTYKELEKASTPLKWRIMSSLTASAFAPDKEHKTLPCRPFSYLSATHLKPVCSIPVSGEDFIRADTRYLEQ